MGDYLTETLDSLGIKYLDHRNGGLNYGRDLTGDGSGWLWLLCTKEELMQRIDELNDCGIEVEYVQVRADNGKAPYHAYVDNGEKRSQAPIGYFARETGRKTSSIANNGITLDQKIKRLEEKLEKINELLSKLSKDSG